MSRVRIPSLTPKLPIMDKELLIEKTKGQSKNGKMSCRHALRLASELDVSPKELGEVLDDLKIKVAGASSAASLKVQTRA